MSKLLRYTLQAPILTAMTCFVPFPPSTRRSALEGEVPEFSNSRPCLLAWTGQEDKNSFIRHRPKTSVGRFGSETVRSPRGS